MNRTKTAIVGGLTAALILLPWGITSAIASAGARASGGPASVATTTFKLAPVALATSANPNGSAYAVSVPASTTAYFFVKNFGAIPVKGFSMIQTKAVKIAYCVNQAFKSASSTTCADNSAAFLLGTATSFANVVFSTPLAAGSSYSFSIRTTGTVFGADSISVTVSGSQAHSPITLIG